VDVKVLPVDVKVHPEDVRVLPEDVNLLEQAEAIKNSKGRMAGLIREGQEDNVCRLSRRGMTIQQIIKVPVTGAAPLNYSRALGLQGCMAGLYNIY
jgi:hypothetical protein